MAFEIQSPGIVLASFATPQEIVISHANDSIRVGDGSDLMGPLTNVGGVLCFPVAIKDIAAGTLATAANQTSGAQKTQIVGEDGLTEIEYDDVGGEKALKVSVIASVGGGGGGTAATDSAAYTATASQFTPIGVAFDDVASDALAEGEMGMLRGTAARSLNVNLAEGISGLATGAKQDTGNTSLGSILTDTTAIKTSVQLIDDTVFVDDAAFTPGASKVLAIGAEADEAGTDSVDEGDIGALRMTLDRMLYVKVGANTTDYATQTTLALMKTALDSLLTSSQLIDDTIFVDDVAFTAATSKVLMIGGQFQSAPNALDDGDAGSILLDTNHAVQAVLRAGTAAIGKLAANSGVDIGDVDVLSLTSAAANAKFDIGLINAVVPLMGGGNTGTGSLRVTIATDNPSNTNAWLIGGPAAVDAAASGNPIVVGGSARLTDFPASQADTAGDVTRLMTDRYGRQMVAGACAPGAVKYQTTTITASASETTIVNAAGSEIHDLIMLHLTNTSATDCLVSLKDSTAGTTRMTFLVPKGGGIVFQPCTPMAQLAAVNNNWTVTGTSVSSLYVNAMYLVRPT